MYEFDFGSELITLHSCTPPHLSNEGILANGRPVSASVPHADSSHATALNDTLRCATCKTLCSAFSDELWEISVLYRIRGSGCHVEDSSTIPTASPPHNYTHLTPRADHNLPFVEHFAHSEPSHLPSDQLERPWTLLGTFRLCLQEGRNACRVERGCLVSV